MKSDKYSSTTMQQTKFSRIIMFLIILFPFFAIVAPFSTIIKMAFLPEGTASSKNNEVVLCSISTQHWQNGRWEEGGAEILPLSNVYAKDEIPIKYEWNINSPDGYVKWIFPFMQNLHNFRYLKIHIKSNASFLKIELHDIHNASTTIKIPITPHQWCNPQLHLSKLDKTVQAIDIEKISSVSFRFESPKQGYIEVKKIAFTYKFLTFTNFKEVLLTASFGRYFLNSTLISLLIMLSNMLFSTMAGFAFASRHFPLRRTLYLATLVMIMIPMQVLMIPTFILIQWFGWLNTYKALVMPFLVSPINIFIMRQYITKIPKDFSEVALVDGASYFKVFFSIILPICKPAMAIIGINTFVTSWNSFLYPFILTNTAEMRTLPVGLALYIGLFDVDWAHLMAASTLAALPAMIVFLFFQKQIIAGVLSGTTYKL
ncbi:carbohydrate ABC transporter permease [bacterium]|nr:carbohydrate ABC transporter permease [bacterium]MCP5462334.1 carbohydrate ABC transporter permease [bacterium]